jgi:hypothetical protein
LNELKERRTQSERIGRHRHRRAVTAVALVVGLRLLRLARRAGNGVV